MFNCGPVYYANSQATEEIIINQGGTDSGKTYAIIQLLFTIAMTTRPHPDDPIITIVGESVPNLKKGAYRVAQLIIQKAPLLAAQIESWNQGDRTFKFFNGWIMEFTSYLTEQQAKQGKRQYLYVNEANGIDWPIFWQLAKKTRIRTFIDYNPSAPFWAHDNLIGTVPSGNDLNASVKLIISDHRHNPFLSKRDHDKTENIKDKERWLVYARGKTGNLEGLIYPNWKQIEDSDFPDVDFFGGLDFGYTSDPTCAVKVAFVGNSVFVHELCYETALTANRIKDIFIVNGFGPNNHIYCELDKDFISELRRLRVAAMPAIKGPGSVKLGILKVNEFNVFITKSSKNIWEERKRYMWEIDKITGKSTNTPTEGYDHGLDAIRYSIYTKFFRNPQR